MLMPPVLDGTDYYEPPLPPEPPLVEPPPIPDPPPIPEPPEDHPLPDLGLPSVPGEPEEAPPEGAPDD